LYTYLSKIISEIFFGGWLHKISQQILVKHINVQRENAVTFWIFEFYKVM